MSDESEVEKIILKWIKRRKRILDVGCGDGRLLIELVKIKTIFQNCDVWTLTYSLQLSTWKDTGSVTE